ncbi:MAG: hypothetical protein FJY75_13405, partial [Candidatus Eisenbacteria bacterium]|nr:hypothetical protein [Candidatus Eisenbacteria bacterium]
DSLTAEQVSLLGRLDARAAPLGRRYPGAPSPESLREIRAAYRELGLDGELMAAVARLAEAADRGVRCAALRALALYGQAGRMERLREECGAAGHLLHLAVAGDTSAVRVAAERYREARAAGRDAGEERTLGLRDKALLLDVAYYLGTPAGEDLILEVAAGDPDSLARARAEWMIAHPLPGEGETD